MNRTALRTAALSGIAALGMLLSAPIASAQPPIQGDWEILSVSTPTIAPGSTGIVDIVIRNVGPTASGDAVADVVLDLNPLQPNARFLTPAPCAGGSCAVTLVSLRSLTMTVQRSVAVDAAAPVGATIVGGTARLIPLNYTDTQPANDSRQWGVLTPTAVGVPLVAPLIGGTAALMVLAGGVAMHRRSRAGSEARN